MAGQFKFMKIYESLRDKIISGEIRHDLPSMRELAETYGVSHITILRVFQELVRNGLIEGKNKALYTVRTRSETARNILISLLRPGRALNNLDNFAAEVLLGVSNAAHARRMNLLTPSQCRAIFFGHATDSALMELAIELHPLLPYTAGIILDAAVSEEQIEKYIRPLNRTIIIAGRASKLPVRTVSFPTDRACREMAELAARSSYDRFILCESARNSDYRSDHAAIWKKILLDRGRSPETVFETPPVLQNQEADQTIADHLAADLKSGGRGLILASSSSGGRFLADALAERGLVAGKHFGLITFDGKASVRSRTPRLTTFRVSGEALGALAVDALLDASPRREYEADFRIEWNETF